MTVGSGATFNAEGANYTQSGGTTLVDGTLIAANFDLNGGTLDGTGSIKANLSNAGTLFAGTPLAR